MDAWGDMEAGVKVCPGDIPDGFIPKGGDCDDNNPEINPMGVEHCDQLDNNCNGLKDELSGMNMQCAGCKLLQNLGHFYFLCTEKVPASGAGALCAAKAVPPAKAYHAKLDSDAEFSFIAPKVMMNGFDVSIGLRDTGGKDLLPEHRWVVDEEALAAYGGTKGVAPWAPAQPDMTLEDWVVITVNGGKWADRKGSDPFYYLCEGEPAP